MTEPEQPQIVQPQPTPESWTFGTAQRGMVVVIISTFSGQHISFLPAAQAIVLGEQLVNAGRQSSSGLYVPSPGAQLPLLPPLTPPNGHP